ncbi:MAG: tetratricopeptide repeat-containing sensor histidine kinase [Mucilaginibacter sp.]|uniref:tetratricopeptide repeat-containing sensor histidine kinase n=1 Tax=Mucilaginibacter sp. TaxID=1882438 RepID=UPI003265A8BA
MPRLSKCVKYFFALLLSAFFTQYGFAQPAKVKELEVKLKQNPADTSRLKLYSQLAKAYGSVDPVKKLYYTKLFKGLAVKLHDENAIVDADLQMGNYYFVQGKMDSTLLVVQQAYVRAVKNKYELGTAKSLSNMGFTYDRLSQTKDAIRCYLDALVILKKLDNKKLLNQLYTNIGSIYFDLRQYKIAESYFNQSLASYTALKDTAGIGYGLFTVGGCYMALHENEKAIDYLTRSLTIREKLGDVNGVALVKKDLGKVYTNKKQYDKALVYLDSALNTVRRLQDKYEECALLLDLCDAYLGMKDYAKAESSALLCLKLSKEVGTKAGDAEAMDRLVSVYTATGDIKKAFKYQSDYIKSQDEFEAARSLKELNMVEVGRVKTENEELNKNNLIISSKNNDNLERLKRYSNVIVITLVILVFVTLLVLVLLKRNREKQAANKQLLLQKEEIATINKELELLNEEIKAQIELTNSQNLELERMNDIKNKFFSIVSHDLRSPIGTLQTLLSIYREGDLSNDELSMLLLKLEDTIINTGTFLDNLLEWSKSQMEGIIINAVNFDVSDCVAENIKLFESKISLKKLEVVNRATEPVTVFADKNMINVVVRNILSNAIKFCNPNDEIVLRVEQRGGRVLITISDTGPGISEAEQQKLFSLEHSLSSSGTHGEKGSHLGLILCQDMVIQNNGKIWFETEPGKGTTFFIDIPAGA